VRRLPELEQQIEEYGVKLNEFGYSAKDIKNDPDMADTMTKLGKLK